MYFPEPGYQFKDCHATVAINETPKVPKGSPKRRRHLKTSSQTFLLRHRISSIRETAPDDDPWDEVDIYGPAFDGNATPQQL